MSRSLQLLPVLLALLFAPARAQTTVPFIGCPSDGQTGPLAAPQGQPKLLHIPPEAARQLAFYKSEYSIGILAPRGWNCFGTYGSAGATLFVSPQPMNAATFFGDKSKGFSGPAIELSNMDGGTFGRFSVAQTIARVFPAHRSFARKVINEGLAPAKAFPFGPYPADKLVYKSKEVVEFQTPPNTAGLGTDSWLKKNDTPIRGVVILDTETPEEPSAITLTMRLPANLSALAPAIIEQVEAPFLRVHNPSAPSRKK